MPGFTIRRKKRKAPTPPPPEKTKVVDDEPESMSESEDSEEAYITARLAEAKLDNKPQPPVNRPQNTQQRHVQFRQPAKPTSQPTNHVPHQYYRRPQPHIMDPYRRKPTMRVPPKPQWGRKAKVEMRYRSHYGPNGAALDTHTKSRLLYTHCFG